MYKVVHALSSYSNAFDCVLVAFSESGSASLYFVQASETVHCRRI